MGKPSKGTPADQRLKANNPNTGKKPAPKPSKGKPRQSLGNSGVQ